MDLKECKMCHELKPIDDFRSNYGRQEKSCKTCTNKRSNSRQRENLRMLRENLDLKLKKMGMN